MAQPNHSEVQVVDPVLTQLLVGYQQAEERFIANRVFPVVPVGLQGFTYYTFTKKYWFLDEMKSRTPGAAYARSGYGLTSTTGYANTWGLEHPIADEARTNNQVPMALEQAGLRWLAQQSLIRRERAFSADFMVTGVWGTDDNNATTDWDDFTGGDPFNDVLTAQRTISNNTGVVPNTMAMGYIVHVALQNHPDIVDRIKHVQIASLGNVESALSSLFGVSQYLVGKATYNSANEGQTMSATAIVDDDCLICYSNNAPGMFAPSAGYTFTWDGGGGNGSVYTYREDQTDSDILKNKEAWDQKAVATDVGYFFADVV